MIKNIVKVKVHFKNSSPIFRSQSLNIIIRIRLSIEPFTSISFPLSLFLSLCSIRFLFFLFFPRFHYNFLLSFRWFILNIWWHRLLMCWLMRTTLSYWIYLFFTKWLFLLWFWFRFFISWLFVLVLYLWYRF